jgi:hypothetical protein
MHTKGHTPRPGDVIEVEGKAVGSPGRSGEILDVLGTADEPHFRVRWEDGHESIYYPSNDARIRVGSDR